MSILESRYAKHPRDGREGKAMVAKQIFIHCALRFSLATIALLFSQS